MLNFKAVLRYNPQDPEAPYKHYAFPVYRSKVGLKEISDEVADKSSLTRGDCYNVIQNFMSVMLKALRNGDIVKLDDLGTFRVTLSSKNAETPQDLSSVAIKRARIRFQPGEELKGMLANLKFAKKEG
ncbi:MAG TPA: HU family DNA-binding protein [Flavobacteriaceae bacterium]|nr:HU family DNA-binding protein [Flavobacteriaceae bacterium]